jgi:chromosome segregation ATPase
VPDSDSDRMAAAEEELKELVKAVSIRGRKWADSKDALKQAENQQAKVEHLLCVLADLVDHVNKMRAHVEQLSDAVYDAEDEEEKAACQAKEAAAAMAECVAGMHRFKATGKPTST